MTPREHGLDRALYSVKETARLLSTSRDAIYKMAHAGKLKIVKLGPKKSRVPGADIAALLNELCGAE
jgi:excisionase family DNA binding protein